MIATIVPEAYVAATVVAHPSGSNGSVPAGTEIAAMAGAVV